jgi:hypothetical protein
MRTHLCDANDLAVSTPTSMLEELGDLRALAGACLAHDDGDRVCLHEVKQSLAVFGNRQQSSWLVEGRDECCTEVEV